MDIPTVEIARFPALRLLAWQLHQERCFDALFVSSAAQTMVRERVQWET